MLGDIHYLNSGDWIESLTAIVEHWDGSYELLEYSNFIKEYPFPEGSPSAEDLGAAEGPEPAPARSEDVRKGSPVV